MALFEGPSLSKAMLEVLGAKAQTATGWLVLGRMEGNTAIGKEHKTLDG